MGYTNLSSLFLPLFLFSISLNTSADDLVPDFIGKNLNYVKKAAKSKGLNLVEQHVYSIESIGEILHQVPASESKLGNKKQIFLRISKGFYVEDYTKNTIESIQARLKRLGISARVERKPHRGVNVGIVATQYPKAKSVVDAEKQGIFLSVSNSKGIKIPDLIGISLYQAKEKLKKVSLGFRDEVRKDSRVKATMCGPDLAVHTLVKKTTPSKGEYLLTNETVNVIYDTWTTSIPGLAKCKCEFGRCIAY